LVLSGGGARGIAYPAMQQAMEENGTLQNITHISGASAGAMTGSFMAIGYSSEEIKLLLTGLNFPNLLDNAGYTRKRARGFRFQNLLDMTYLIQIRQQLKTVSTPVKSELKPIYDRLNQKVSDYDSVFSSIDVKLETVQDLVDLSNIDGKFKEIDQALRIFSSRGRDESGKLMPSSRFTFADFENLRCLLPQAKQYEIKHLSVVSTNLDKGTLEVHNYQQCAGESVAECAQRSGAHPILFSAVKSADGEYYADGALHDNMPSHVLEELGLSDHEILCAALLSKDDIDYRLQVAKGLAPHTISKVAEKVDGWFHSIFGTKICRYFADSYNREKRFFHLGNMLYLNTGDLSITDVKPTDEKKDFALNQAYKQTQDLFENRNQHFSNPILAMLFLGNDSLEKYMLESQNSDPEHAILTWKVKCIFTIQNEIVKFLSSDNTDVKNIQQSLLKLQNSIASPQLGLSPEEQQQALALCYKQINYLSNGRLENCCQKTIANDPSMAKEEVSWWQAILTLLWQCVEWMFTSVKNLIVKPEPIVELNTSEIINFDDDEEMMGFGEEEIINSEDKVISPDIEAQQPNTSPEVKQPPSATVRFFSPILEDIETEHNYISIFGY
jgi:VPS inhibitor protein D